MKVTTKYILLMFMIIFSFVSVFVLSFEYFIIPWHVDMMEQQTSETARFIQRSAPYFNLDRQQEFLEKLMRDNKDLYYILIVDKNGKALAHSNPARRGMVFNDSGTLQAARSGKEFRQIYTRDLGNPSSPYFGEKVIDIFVPYLDTLNNQTGAVNVGLSLKSVNSEKTKYYIFLSLFSFLLFLTGIIIIRKFLTDFLKPIKKLSQAAEEFSKTGNIVNIPPHGDYEISVLVREFNSMQNNIHGLISSLKMSKNDLQDYIDHLFSLSAKLSPEGRVLLLNNTAVEISGCRMEDMIGKFFWELDFWNYSPELQELLKENLAKAATGQTVRFESLDKVKNGFINLDISLKPVSDISGNVSYIIAEGRNIDKRIKAEKLLGESEIQYKTLVENIPARIFLKDRNSVYLSCNLLFASDFGMTPEKITGRRDIDFAPPELARGFRDEDIAILTQGKVIDKMTSFIVGNEEIFFQKIKIPIRNKEGNIDKILGIIWDITKIKNSEEKIRNLTLAVEQSPSGIILTDTEGRIIYVNPAFVKTSGYHENELTGVLLSDKRAMVYHSLVFQNIWNEVQLGNEWKGEFYNTRKNGEIYWMYSSVSPIKDSRDKIRNYLLILEDITERKNSESELIKAKEKAENSDRLKSEFLAQISHEIRTPINSILSYSSLLKMELENSLPDDLRDSFKIIENGGKRLIRTIDLLLNMSEIKTGNYELSIRSTDLYVDILTRVYNELKIGALNKGLEILLIRETDDTTVFCDQYTITQVFINLIENAIKYTHSGFVKIILKKSEGNTIVDIEDTGIGISREYMKDLFTPFSQEESGYTRRFEGNGLGLALVKKYCEINNARIYVKSEKGKGSTFSVVFPNK